MAEVRRATVKITPDEVTPQSVNAMLRAVQGRGPGEELTHAVEVLIRQVQAHKRNGKRTALVMTISEHTNGGD